MFNISGLGTLIVIGLIGLVSAFLLVVGSIGYVLYLAGRAAFGG